MLPASLITLSLVRIVSYLLMKVGTVQPKTFIHDDHAVEEHNALKKHVGLSPTANIAGIYSGVKSKANSLVNPMSYVNYAEQTVEGWAHNVINSDFVSGAQHWVGEIMNGGFAADMQSWLDWLMHADWIAYVFEFIDEHLGLIGLGGVGLIGYQLLKRSRAAAQFTYFILNTPDIRTIRLVLSANRIAHKAPPVITETSENGPLVLVAVANYHIGLMRRLMEKMSIKFKEVSGDQ